jgi:hypothetical protein
MPPRLIRIARRPHAFVLVLLGALFACDFRSPTLIPNPDLPAPVDGPRTSASGSVVLYSAPVDFDWWRLAEIRDSSWVLLEVTGRVGYTRNPLCYEHPGYCDGPPTWLETEGPFGPLEHGGFVKVTTRRPGEPNPSGGVADQLFSPTDDSKDSVGRWLFHNTTGPRTVWLRGEWAQTYAGNPTSPTVGYWPVFLHDRGQSVTLMEIPQPLDVAGPSALRPGEAGTWTATIARDLRLRGLDGTPAAVTWYFARGDSLPVANETAPRVLIGACTTLECTYTPPASGRLEAVTSVERKSVRVKSQVVRVQESELVLTCNGVEAPGAATLERTGSIDCGVRAEPSGDAEIIGWEFVADSIDYRNPAPGATPFRGIVWSGTMVVGGTVRVRARLEGEVEPRSAQVQVKVTPRAWSGRAFPTQVEEEPATDLPPRPDSVQHLGEIQHFLATEVSRDKWEPILSGPNANLGYLVDLPVSYRGTIHVNRTALAVGSDFWNAQPTRQRSVGVVDCLRREEDILGFIPVILRHEGLGFDPKSHAFLYVEEAKRVGNPRFEAVVGTSLGELADQAEAISDLVHDAARTASDLADTPGYRPSWCRFNFNYSGM